MAAPAAESSRGSPKIGLIYDERMCSHKDPNGHHPENPERIRAIWRKLESEGITRRCVVLNAKEADDKHLELVHSKNHINLIKNISSDAFGSKRQRIGSMYNSIYFNEGSSEAAYLAAGAVVEVAEKVAKGDLTSAVAIVRPPGHHAIPNAPMGFCLFNNVAVAASYLLNERPDLGIKKILIVDWDVHHGNGTQDMFYSDPRVLYFSVHRFDFGTFYPVGDDGAHYMIGGGPGAGYNINVPWEHGQCGDADYCAVWDHVLIPVAKAYNPDIILVSAGFDAAFGDPLGGCCITPYGYSILLQKLMAFAQGKIVVVLEGGYNLKSIANSVLACAEVLLGDDCSFEHIQTESFEATWRVIEMVRRELAPYWPVLGAELPKTLPTKKYKPSLEEDLYYSSESDETDDLAEDVEDSVIIPLSKIDLNGNDDGQLVTSTQVDGTTVTSETSNDVLPREIVNNVNTWRSVLSKVDVWYASYGSNMWKPRFMCYIEGGKVEGMNLQCCGSLDKSSPKDAMWKILPHQLFFGRSHTRTWGSGGVAFLHPESDIKTKAQIAMYRITLEQFNDILIQENSLHQEDGKVEGMESPLLDLSVLNYVINNGSVTLEVLKDGWYSNVLYLGKEDNIPILTMTCSLSDIERFRSSEVPICAPSTEYMNTLVNGLVEGRRFTREEAIDYISDATSCEL